MAIKMPLPQLSRHPLLYTAYGFKPFGTVLVNYTLVYHKVGVVFRDFNVTLHLITESSAEEACFHFKIAKTLPGGFQQSLVLF